MRIILLAAAVLTLAACSKSADTASAPASSAPAAMKDAAQGPAAASSATPTPSAPQAKDMSNMPAMDAASMAASAAADAGPLVETPDNHMFHVLQGIKEEKVVLPAKDGEKWTPDKPSSVLYNLKDTTSAKLSDGTSVQVFTFSMLKPGNATVVFKSDGKAPQMRTVMFMIH